MRFVERDTDDFRIVESERIFPAFSAQPIEQIAGGYDRSGDFEFFLGFADPLSNPGKI